MTTIRLFLQLLNYDVKSLKITFSNKSTLDQILKSRTTIGAPTTEVECSTSKKELSHKLSFVKNFKYSAKLFLIFTFSFLTSSLCSDTQASVIINEVYPNPLTGESEWIELYNTATESATLSSWQLKDVLSTPSVAYQFSATDSIDGLSYKFVELTSQKLNNSADGVRLYNHLGELVDGMDYASSQQSMSWSRLQATSNDWHLTPPSKGSQNPLPTPSPTATPLPSSSPAPPHTPTHAIKLISFSPCPNAGDQEYIELENTDDAQVTISEWRLIDKDENYKDISGTLTAHAVTQISWSGSLLNNAGDTFTLQTDTAETLVVIEYGECQRGKAFYFDNNQWQQDMPLSEYNQSSDSNITGVKKIESGNNTVDNNSDTVKFEEIVKDRHNEKYYGATPAAIITKLPSKFLDTTSETPSLFQETPLISKSGIVSVIMGGSLISLSGLLQLYEKIRLLKTQVLA